MAGIKNGSFQSAGGAAWIGDYLSREHLIPGGARLDAAQFTANAAGQKYVSSGVPVGRTYAERDTNTNFGPALLSDDEIFLVVYDCTDALVNPDIELYRRGSLVKENYLPDIGTMVSGLKDKLRIIYQMTRGGE